MNWGLTLTKGLVIGCLAAIGVVAADIQTIAPWWAGLAALAVEAIRDVIKTRFGSFAVSESE